MGTAVKTSELCKAVVGQAGAPYSKKIIIANSGLTVTQGGLIHSIEVDGTTVGNLGPGPTSLRL